MLIEISSTLIEILYSMERTKKLNCEKKTLKIRRVNCP